MIVYISIGNSDDKLTQSEWAEFYEEVDNLWFNYPLQAVHGRWLSNPSHPWQNACWCIEISDESMYIDGIKKDLADIANRYIQDSIAWAQVPATEFLNSK